MSGTSTSSVNTRHPQEKGGDVFISPPKDPEGTVEIVCSSSRRRMDHSAGYKSYRLLSHTLTVTPTPVPSWPQTTDVHCWNCCHGFSGAPISIPRSREVINSKQLYEVYGVFCSLNCAKKYLLEKDTHDKQDLLMQLNVLCVDVFGMTPEQVFNAKEAPPRMFLKMFGGHLGIEEYREKRVGTRTLLVTPPFVSHAMLLEEHSGQRGPASVDTTPVDPVIEPLREGQHELRGLRRPTNPLPIPPTQNTPSESRFDAFVKARARCSPSEVRTPKRARRTKTPPTPQTPLTGGLGSFLK
jgi:hypothetical protein